VRFHFRAHFLHDQGHRRCTLVDIPLLDPFDEHGSINIAPLVRRALHVRAEETGCPHHAQARQSLYSRQGPAFYCSIDSAHDLDHRGRDEPQQRKRLPAETTESQEQACRVWSEFGGSPCPSETPAMLLFVQQSKT